MEKEVFVLEFSPEEASLGAKYAKEKYGIQLNTCILQARTTLVLRRMHSERPECFADAKRNVLDVADIHPWDNIFKVWDSALSKMFSQRNVEKKARARARRKLSLAVTVIREKNGQFAWKF